MAVCDARLKNQSSSVGKQNMPFVISKFLRARNIKSSRRATELADDANSRPVQPIDLVACPAVLKRDAVCVGIESLKLT